MTDTMTIELSARARKDIEDAARAAGLSPEAFVADAAEKRARAIADAEGFFRERAQGADLSALDLLMRRAGDERPRPGDEKE